MLLDEVLTRSTGAGSRVHGPAHWAGVAAAGLTLLDQTPDADPLVVLLFALFHDSMRRTDGHDPEHGSRAADLAAELREAGEFELDDARMDTLCEALVFHDKGKTSTDPTIGVCWDADRLNLWRLMRRPDPVLLSTAAARRVPEQIARGFAGLAFDWRALFLEYAAKRDPRSVYLRFGDLPPCGTSSAYLFGLRECGVSVYPGSRPDDGFYVLDFRRPLLGIDTRFLAPLLWMGRPLYVVEGKQVGVGGCGEPVLEDARIVEEVAPRSVNVLPERPNFKKLIEAWGLKREGKDPGAGAFVVGREPDQRRALPFVANDTVAGFWDTVEHQKREILKGWGLLEGYDRMQAESKARRERKKSEVDFRQSFDQSFSQSFNSASWKEAPWK